MEYIYLVTGLLTVAFAIAGLVVTCYLERRWLNTRKTGPDKNASSQVNSGGLST